MFWSPFNQKIERMSGIFKKNKILVKLIKTCSEDTRNFKTFLFRIVSERSGNKDEDIRLILSPTSKFKLKANSAPMRAVFILKFSKLPFEI